MSPRAEDHLIKEFTPWGLSSANELYLPASKVLELIERAEKEDLAVIGIEGLNVVGKELHPRLDLIADYSSAKADHWNAFRKVCNQAATRFIRDMPLEPNLVFSVVLISEDEREEFRSTERENKRRQG